MKRWPIFSVFFIVACFMSSLNASAASISGGVSDAEITARQTRDGASGINFIDLTSTITGNGWITSFSIYAQSSTPGWGSNADARELKLIIFRANGSNYDVVGKSPMETIPAGGWDKKYIFALPGSGIHVQAGDYIGWYYPTQGSITDQSTPGGVIAFDRVSLASGGHDVRYTAPWGYQAEISDSVPQSDFDGVLYVAEGAGRIYSINVSGTTQASVPIPAAALLFAPGLACLAIIRRRFKK